MKIKKELVKREIAGDTVLVPIGKTVYDSNGLFILNGAGAFLWDCLESAETEDDLLRAMLEEYDVPRETALADIRDFLEELRELEIL